MSAPAFVQTLASTGNTKFATRIVLTVGQFADGTTGSPTAPAGHSAVLLIAHSSQSTATTFGVTGSAGNTWTDDADKDIASNKGVAAFSAQLMSPLVPGSTVTANLAAGLSGEKLSAVLIELDQYVAADAVGYDQTSSSGTSLNASLTTVTDNCLLIGAAVGTGTVTFTQGTGFTAGPHAVTAIGTPDQQVFTEYMTLGAHGATAATFTLTPAQITAALGVAYKSAVPPNPPSRWRLEHGVWVDRSLRYQLHSGSWLKCP